MVNIEQGSRSKEQEKQPILATEEGIEALKRAIADAREELTRKTSQIGIIAIDGDRDYHENFPLRDLLLEVEGPLSRRVIELESQLLRAIIGIGTGNFYHLFRAIIKTPEDYTETQMVRLVGPLEVNHIGHIGPNGEMYVSYESPLGKVILQAELLPGATYIFEAPVGRGKVTILEVKKDPKG